ncbi:MAG: hypothetical protein WBW62_09050, partial [Solirubrobacterales bacterium]
QQNLAEYGGFFAGRGGAINELLGQLPPLLKVAEPVTRNLSSKETDLAGFINGLSQAAAEVAPVADQQASQFVALDTTFTALAEVARPFMQDAITEGYQTELAVQREAPRIRPFLYASARFARAFLPGAIALGESAPIVNSSLDVGIPVLKSSPRLNKQLAPTARSLRRFGESTSVNAGLDTLIETNETLKPLLSFVSPVQNVCNYLALVLNNVVQANSTGSAEGRFVRAISVLPPVGLDAEGNPAAAPANGGSRPFSFLHSIPYPNTAAPGQTRECEAGNEVSSSTPFNPNAQMIGNIPGNQGVVTKNQTKKQLNWGLAK